MSITCLIRIAVSLLPVFLFLTALIFLDSYRLVRLRAVLVAIAVGSLSTVLAYAANSRIIEALDLEMQFYSRYGAPIVEEILKAGYLVYLLKAKKVGFMVDGAIYGFAVGAGFAFVENIYYLQTVQNPNIVLWMIRGLGTAVMHGGTTAVFGIIATHLTDRFPSRNMRVFVPGLVLAIVFHSFYNHFILSPVLFTVVLLITLPLLITIVFERSEKATRNWLGVGFDTDIELLDMINSGQFSQSRIGKYLQSLQGRFPGEVVADMLCYLRLYVELSMSAKGMLLMRETGFRTVPEVEIQEKFLELRYLEKSMGKTGKLAILPFLHTDRRDLWQLQLLASK